MPTMSPRLVLLAAVTALATVVSVAPPATASATDQARQRALRLADQVSQLELQVEVAGEQLAAQQDQLADVVQQQVASQHRLDTAQATAVSDNRAFGRQVRALYLTAGTVSLLPNLLNGDSPQDVLSQLDTVSRVVQQQQRVAQGVQSHLGAISSTASRLEQLADRRTRLSAQAEAAQAHIQTLLAQRQQALSDASADVRRLEQADLDRKAAAAAARAAAALRAVQVPVSPDLPDPLPAASPVATTAIAAARAELGKPYVYAGNGPDSFDCSGLTRWAYAAAGISLPRTSREQWNVGPHPALNELQPGDLLFWATDTSNPATIHHVALYVGAGWMIQAPHTGEFVEFSRLYLDGYIGATRPTGV